MKMTDPPAKAFDSENAIRERNEAGQFLNGHKRGRGRPKGSRTKLAEDVVSDVLESWRQHGPIVLERLACLDPGKYADFIAKVLPREVKVEHRMIDSISDEELQTMLDIAERMAAGGVIIEGTAVEAAPSLPPPMAAAPPTSAEQRAQALRRDLNDQHDAIEAAAPTLPSQDIRPEDLF